MRTVVVDVCATGRELGLLFVAGKNGGLSADIPEMTGVYGEGTRPAENLHKKNLPSDWEGCIAEAGFEPTTSGL